MSQKKLDLFQFSAGSVAEASAGDREEPVLSRPIALADSFTMCHTDFSVMPSPQVSPALFTRRKSFPRSIAAAFNHRSNSHLTQPGTGTVRTCPALPLSRLRPNDLPAAGDDPMSKPRLHAFSSRKPAAEPGVLDPACPPAALCRVPARVFGPALQLANCQDARPASSRL